MKIIDRNIADQTRGIYCRIDGNGSGWRDILSEKGSQQVLKDGDLVDADNGVVRVIKK